MAAGSGYMTDGVVKKFSDGTLTILDGTATAKSIVVHLEEGFFSYTEKDSFSWHKDRGTLDHRRSGEQEAMDVTFSAKYTGYYSSTSDVPSPYEAVTGRGQCATAWTSTTDGASDVYSVDLKLTYTDIDDSATETITFHDFAASSIQFTEGEEANVIAFTGDAVGSSSTTYPEIGGAAS